MTARAAIDWTEAHERLARARRALERGAEPSAGDAERELERRARELARVPEKQAPVGEVLDVVIASVAGERYAIEAVRVLEVLKAGPLTPVPGTPAFVLGVANRRGRILPVLDLAPLLGRPDGAAEAGQVVTVDVEGMTFGIAAAGVEGPVRVEVAELTADLVGVLDLPGLVAGRRLVVDEG